MASAFVSVIVPAYNAESFIGEALRSVADQTFDDIEVIIIDDGSTDSTSEQIKPFLDDYRFRYIYQESRGVSAARNAGIKESSGQWVAFLDSDDVWEPGKLEMQVELIRQCPEASLVFSNGIEFNDHGDIRPFYKRKKKFPEGDVLYRLLRGNCYWTSSVMVRRRDIVEAGVFSEELEAAEDYEIWIKVLRRGGIARGVWEFATRYRIRPGSLMRNKVKVYEALLKMYNNVLEISSDPVYKDIITESLARTRSDLTISQARKSYMENPEDLASLRKSLYSAWKQYPRRRKVLRWLIFLWLGNSKAVVEALARKW